MANTSKAQVPVGGLVAKLEFHLETTGDDEWLYVRAIESRSSLEEAIQRSVRMTLGNDFEAAHVQFERGSLTITFLILTTGSILVGVGKYKSICESLDLIRRQLTQLFGDFFADPTGYPLRAPTSVSGSWTAQGALLTVPSALQSSGYRDSPPMLLWYLVLSHALLLGLLIWLVVTRMK